MKVLTQNTPSEKIASAFVSAQNCMQIKHREMSIKREQHKEIEFRAAVDEAMRSPRRQSSIEKLMTNTTRMWIKTSDSNERRNFAII